MKSLIKVIISGIVLLAGMSALTGCGRITENKPAAQKTISQTEDAPRGTSVGQIAPDFALEKTDGTKISFKDLEGSPSVLVFWTAWCPASKEEAPKINQLAAEFESKGVKVIGINIGESDARINEGIRDFGIKYTVAKDRNAAVSKTYNVVGTPTIVFLDKKGDVQYFGNELPKDYAEKLMASLGS
jgi:peroxiredoxin